MTRSKSRVLDAGPDLILFDAGGTLVLLNPDRLNAFLAEWDLPAVEAPRLSEAHYRAMSDYGNRLEAGENLQFPWWVERFFGLAGLAVPPGMLEAFQGGRGMWNFAIPGAREAVLDLRAKGFRVAVVSNSDGTVADELALAGFDGLFELVVDSTVVGISKPNPGIFEVALTALDVPADQTWYVGDSHYHDVGGARAVGLAAAVLIDPLVLGPPGMLSLRSITELSGLLAQRA